MKSFRILALEPYYGGSHRAFLDTWIRHSCHEWTLETLPARSWKWRMRGAAIWFAHRLEDVPVGRFDAVFTCDMASVTDLRALLPLGLRTLPLICYFHENQLTYPLSPTDWRDYQYGFTNITSGLAADGVWFNSYTHRKAFLSASADLFRKMSDYVPWHAIEILERVSEVHYPAVEMPVLPSLVDRSARKSPLRILWSHRWEYDKNPESFFAVMLRLHEANADFELVIVGERFRSVPDAFSDAYEKLKGRVRHAGYLDSLDAYWKMISSCDVIVSTAIQENFGLAVVEAVFAGCHPLLPNRLSYPELLPVEFHTQCLYASEDDLFVRLMDLCASTRETSSEKSTSPLSVLLTAALVERFGATKQVPRLDKAFATHITSRRQ